MRIILERALFDVQSEPEATSLLDIFANLTRDPHRHALITDPVYEPGGANGELLASAASQSTQTIFQKQPKIDPANCIIAEPGEARRVRDYFGKLAARKRSGEIESSNEAAREADQDILRLLDELGIPAEALGKLPDEKAFLAERRRWLFQQEEAFLQKLGLRVRENAH